MIFNLHDTGHRPGRPLDDVAFAPQVNLAVEPDHVTVDPYVNILGVHFGTAFERILDTLADIDDVHPRAEGQAVVHADHAGQLAHRTLDGLFLVLPVHFALKGDPAFLHDDLDRVVGDVGAPIDDVQGAAGDSVVRRSGAFLQAYLDFLGHRAHAFDAFYRALGADFLIVAIDVPGERDNAVFHGHTDVGRVDMRLEFKLFQNGVTQTQIAHDGVLCRNITDDGP